MQVMYTATNRFLVTCQDHLKDETGIAVVIVIANPSDPLA